MIPKRTRETIDDYVDLGLTPGSFVLAVLQNDLRTAVWKADRENLAALPQIVDYCGSEIPADCWGSPRAVREWLGKFRGANLL